MMIAAVDPNKKDLKRLAKQLRMVFAGCELILFSDPKAAALFIQNNPIDVLYTEVVMRGMTGFALQESAEAVQPDVLTVAVTSTDEYALKAIKMRTHGYIVKPVTWEAVHASMNEIKFRAI